MTPEKTPPASPQVAPHHAVAPPQAVAPPIFVISLARAVERRAEMIRRLDLLGVSYEIFEAVDGEKIADVDLHRFVDDEFWRVNRGRRLSLGEVGCAMSHYQLWQKIAVERIPFAVVLEDDAVLDADFAEIISALPALKSEWDMVILHNKKSYAYERALCKVGGCTASGGEGRQLVRYQRRIGQTVAYVVTTSAAEQLVDYCHPFTAPIDWLAGEWWRNGLKYYGVYPPVAKHDREESTISTLPRSRRSIGEHLSALCYRLRDSRLRRRMLREITPKCEE